jgi:hypothetical protein
MDTITSTCTVCGHSSAPIDAGHAEVEKFRLVGEYWAIRFAGRTCNVHDGKGLGYIAQLLRVPGRELHALDLLAADDHEGVCHHDDCEADDAYAVVERARLSVTRAIRRAQARIAACHPSLGRHFETTLRTGTYCAYVPDSRVPIAWDVG